MIVDVEHHFRVARPGMGTTVERYWGEDGKLHYSQANSGADIDEHLRFMDAAGIDLAVLSGNVVDPTLDKVKTWNDTCARAIADHPTRFAGFAAAMPTAGDPEFRELERAVTELDMKGVHISARPDGHFLDSKALWPFYAKVQELGVPIDVHVETYPTGYDEALDAPYALYYIIGRELDITAAVFRLCFGGVLEDFPELKLIVNHFGGGFTAIKDRIDLYVDYLGDDFYQDEPLISRPWNEYYDKLYFNIAGRGPAIPTLKCALTSIHPSKLLFGSDWPPNFEDDPASCKAYIDDIRALDLPQADIDAMLGGNAVALLGLETGRG